MVLFGVLTGVGSRSSYSAGPDDEEHRRPPVRADRPGRRGGHRQLPLRPPAARRRRQHHRPGRIADRSAGWLSGRTDRPDRRRSTSNCRRQRHPWAKAGLIMKADTAQGSAYAAVMVTGGHGVRMQYNFTGDIAGPADVGVPAVAAADPDRRHRHRVGVGRRHDVDDGRRRSTSRAAVGSCWPACSSRHRSTRAITQQLGGGGSVTGGPTVATATVRFRCAAGNWTGRWNGDTVGDGLDADAAGRHRRLRSRRPARSPSAVPATSHPATAAAARRSNACWSAASRR